MKTNDYFIDRFLCNEINVPSEDLIIHTVTRENGDTGSEALNQRSLTQLVQGRLQ